MPISVRSRARCIICWQIARHHFSGDHLECEWCTVSFESKVFCSSNPVFCLYLYAAVISLNKQTKNLECMQHLTESCLLTESSFSTMIYWHCYSDQNASKCRCSLIVTLHVLRWTEWRLWDWMAPVCVTFTYLILCVSDSRQESRHFSSEWHISIYQIRVNLEKLRFELSFIINAACIVDGITASETTFVCVFKAQGIVTSDILRSQTDHALPYIV